VFAVLHDQPLKHAHWTHRRNGGPASQTTQNRSSLGTRAADDRTPWRSTAMPTRNTKQLAAAKTSGRPTHVILATRADGSDAVKIGSGWQRVSGDLHLKLRCRRASH
jgi:hypothetical protein